MNIASTTKIAIIVETIPAAEQRYGTVGDWWFSDDGDVLVLNIRVSRLGDWRYEACIAIHEQSEALECLATGVSSKIVDDFDMQWESHNGIEEPGDDPEAPYYWPHQRATVVEKHLANCLGVDWVAYGQTIEALG